MRDPKHRILVGDNRLTLNKIPTGIIQTVVTSPPYYAQRDYQVNGQIGLEPTPDEFFKSIIDVFREVKRVLRDDGTVWMNLGDKFENKKLLAMAWRTAFALMGDGWALRQDVIWSKMNPMPTPDCGRCTPSHEYVFLMTKETKENSWYFDLDAIEEKAKNGSYKLSDGFRPGKYVSGQSFNNSAVSTNKPTKVTNIESDTRHRRSVWEINTFAEKDAHTATFPPRLAEMCILAGTPEKGCCEHCRAPYIRITEKTRVPTRNVVTTKVTGDALVDGNRDPERHITLTKTLGWQKSCECDSTNPIPSLVLDPFLGSGTTVGVALKLGRDGVGCEINPDYVKICERKIEEFRLKKGFDL